MSLRHREHTRFLACDARATRALRSRKFTRQRLRRFKKHCRDAARHSHKAFNAYFAP